MMNKVLNLFACKQLKSYFLVKSYIYYVNDNNSVVW